MERPKGKPTFPIAEAKAEAQRNRIAYKFRQNYGQDVEPGSESDDDTSEEEETKMFLQQQEDANQEDLAEQDRLAEEETRILGTGFGGQNVPLPNEIPKDFMKHFHSGGWFCRLSRAVEGE